MGRGRAKAKQTKVARRLKYHSPNTDFSALQQELGTGEEADDEYEETDDAVDEYADVGRDTDEREPHEEDWLPRKR